MLSEAVCRRLADAGDLTGAFKQNGIGCVGGRDRRELAGAQSSREIGRFSTSLACDDFLGLWPDGAGGMKVGGPYLRVQAGVDSGCGVTPLATG